MSEVKIKLTITDNYLMNYHDLYVGVEYMANPVYTSTKKLKGYLVLDKKRDRNVFIGIDECKLITTKSDKKTIEHLKDRPLSVLMIIYFLSAIINLFI